MLTTTKLQKFVWDKNKPINYNNKKIKWPLSQNLKKYYIINSGIFLAHKNIYINFKDRIGKKPFFFNLNELESFDVDTNDDFAFVKKIIYVNKKKII